VLDLQEWIQAPEDQRTFLGESHLHAIRNQRDCRKLLGVFPQHE